MSLSLRFTARKTFELSEEQKIRICHLSEKILGLGLSDSSFGKRYQFNELGYSYHGLMFADDIIVGSCAIVPQKYSLFGEVKIIGLVADTMIERDYRRCDPFALKKMADASSELMQSDNIGFIFAVPNPKAYLYWKKFVKWRDIGELDFFILPINIGNIKHNIRYFNILSRFFSYFCNLLVYNVYLKSTESCFEQRIHLIKDQMFYKHRYDDTYKGFSPHNDFSFIYRICDEEGAKIAYLIDVIPLGKKKLEYAVKKIYLEERDNIDAIVYIGNIKFTAKNIFRVPERLRPRKVVMCGQFTKDGIDERVFNLNNWAVNLSNFDVR